MKEDIKELKEKFLKFHESHEKIKQNLKEFEEIEYLENSSILEQIIYSSLNKKITLKDEEKNIDDILSQFLRPQINLTLMLGHKKIFKWETYINIHHIAL